MRSTLPQSRPSGELPLALHHNCGTQQKHLHGLRGLLHWQLERCCSLHLLHFDTFRQPPSFLLPPSRCSVVLGVLPHVQLQLPDDPPGIYHPMSCLLEAVQPLQHAASPTLHPESDATAGDSQPSDGGSERNGGGTAAAAITEACGLATAALRPALRLTVFAAGAVWRRHTLARLV